MAEIAETHAQYDDWIGAAAADNSDPNDMRALFGGQKPIEENELLISIEPSGKRI